MSAVPHPFPPRVPRHRRSTAAHRSPLRRALVTALALTTLLVPALSTPAHAAPAHAAPAPQAGAVPAATQATTTPILGTARGQLYAADGSVDIAGTVNELSARHINTFAFLINGTKEWNAFPALLTAAAAKGINVWAYIRPPSESSCSYSVPVGQRTPCYPPYQWDYKGWANGVATLTSSHPNLTGMLIDDFGGNTAEAAVGYSFAFSQTYVAQMMAGARSIAPSLKLYTIMYWTDIASRAVQYKEEVDGYVYAYNHDPTPNTQQTDTAESQTRTVASMTKCHGGSGCLELMFPTGQVSTAGAYGGVSQQISVTAAASHTLTFSAASMNFAGQPAGYQYLQVLIDGAVVWQRDVTAGSGWNTYSVDASAALAGKTSATLTLRLYHRNAVNSYFGGGWFDDVSGTNLTVSNGNFENATLDGTWPYSESMAAFSESRARTQQLLLMPYASRISQDGAGYVTTQAYVRTMTQLGMTLLGQGLLDGVMPWNTNLYYQMTPPQDANALGNTGSAEVVSELFDRTGGGCATLGYPSGAPSTTGWYAAYSQTVNVTSPATASLTYWLRRDSANLSGYHRVQLIVNGTLLVDRDITGFPSSEWQRYTVSLASAVSSPGSATVTFRIYEAAGVNSYGATVMLDDVTGTGLTVSNGVFASSAMTGWTFASNGSNWTHGFRAAASCA